MAQAKRVKTSKVRVGQPPPSEKALEVARKHLLCERNIRERWGAQREATRAHLLAEVLDAFARSSRSRASGARK